MFVMRGYHCAALFAMAAKEGVKMEIMTTFALWMLKWTVGFFWIALILLGFVFFVIMLVIFARTDIIPNVLERAKQSEKKR